MKQSIAEILRNRLEALELCSPSSAISATASMLQWLGPAAAQIGLTKFEEPVSFIQEIAMPVLDLLPHIPSTTEAVAEIGPGSGGAGLTIASLCPDIVVHMIDRRSRVCAFVDVAAAKFDLDNVLTRNQDLEELAAEHPGFDVVTARAVASPEDLTNSIVETVAPGGRIALYYTASTSVDLVGTNLLKEIPTNVSNLKILLYQRCSTKCDELDA